MNNITPPALKALADGEIENAIIASTPGGVEAQEKAGQRALVASAKIPKELIGCTIQDLEALGFTFSNKQSDDPLFIEATLPAGWSKRATDHDMWSDIIDETGKVRFNVFYKAAFYDRRADMSPAR